MYNITLVCTRHEKIGKCNSNELYHIIEVIDPEVIFEEIPPSFFDKYYEQKSHNNLEADTINAFLETHKVEHIPVDSDDIPPESFFQDHEYMLKQIEGLADVNGFHYRNLIDRNRSYVEMYGFQYLNSIYSINYNDEIYDAIEKGLEKINDDKLFQTYKLWKEVNENRENEMLQNIYSYSKDHSYNRAIFTIGAAHRKPIMDKIPEFEKSNKRELKWNFNYFT